MAQWEPKKAEKANGYFVVKDLKDEEGKPIRRYAGVFFKREEDAKKHCAMVNALSENKRYEKNDGKKKERRKRNGE